MVDVCYTIGVPNRNKPEYKSKYDGKWYKLNGARKRAYNKSYNRSIRLKSIELLGGKCHRCGFSDWRALQFDHTNGGGNRDTKNMSGMKNKVIHDRISSGEHPYQLLCANCNWIKRYEEDETTSIDLV